MDFEIARVLFAGMSAVATAAQAWRKHREAKLAAAAFDTTYHKTLASPEATAAAEELAAIIPADVIKDLEARAEQCWTGYRDVLGGDYLPNEVDKATGSVQCRALCA